ncbi:MAG: cytochrome P460 family protein [Litoreibacter sp.]
MNFRTTLTAAAFVAASLSTGAASAACKVDVEDPFDLEEAGVVALYDCLKDTLAEGYAKEGDEIATNYRSWTNSATRPAVAGAHSNRFLQTFANDIAAEQYLKFAEEGVVMPVGSILAKESFGINKKKLEGRPGALFTMIKLEAGGAPEFGDWLYGGIQPNGKPLKIKQSFCHNCHAGWEEQDFLAYPLEEVRVGQ